MKKRRLLLIAGTLAVCVVMLAVGVILVALAMLPERPTVMKEDVDRLQVGMTLDEVTAIVGRAHVNHAKTRNMGGIARGVIHVWNVKDPVGTIYILINDADSRVVQMTFNPGDQIPWLETAFPP